MVEVEFQVPEQGFSSREYKVPKEKKIFWDKGYEDGTAFMKEKYELSGGQPIYGERVRSFEPYDEVIEEYMQLSNLVFRLPSDDKYYRDAFNMACQQGYPRLDM